MFSQPEIEFTRFARSGIIYGDAREAERSIHVIDGEQFLGLVILVVFEKLLVHRDTDRLGFHSIEMNSIEILIYRRIE